MKIIALILIVAGAIGLGYGVISFKHKEKIIDVGSIEVTADKVESFRISPWLGGGVLVVGVLLLVIPMRK